MLYLIVGSPGVLVASNYNKDGGGGTIMHTKFRQNQSTQFVLATACTTDIVFSTIS